MAHSTLFRSLPFWLVALSVLSVGCKQNPMHDQTSSETNHKLFELATNTGVDFANVINDTGDVTLYDSDLIYAGAGVATGDINNDGLVDIFFAGNQVASRLYLNLGDFKFRDITGSAGIFNNGWSTGVTMADVNGDGFLDIYVCVTGFKQEENKRNLLFINNGDATFSEKGSSLMIDDNGASQMASFFDYDNDGDLDLYVVNQPDDISNTFQLPFYLDPKLVDTLNCSQLYENVGNSFKNVTAESGIGYVNADGFQVSIADLNNDGYLDMYVNNDLLQPDFLYYNNGDKTFTEALNSHMNVVPLFSMGSTFSDFNNDGRLDVIATEMMPPSHLRRKNSMPHPDVEFYDYVLNKAFDSEQRSRNMLQIQNVDGSFSEIGELANVSRTDWSWAALGCDFNNDGYQDLFISNGVKKDVFDQTYLALAFDDQEPQEYKYHHKAKELIKDMPVYLMSNYVFENGKDLSFIDRSSDWGVDQPVASQGAAYADLNNDGYLDLIVSNTDSVAHILKNLGPSFLNRHYLKVKLKGDNKNRFGLGAKVTVYSNGLIQTQQMQNAQGWYSSSEPTLFFGLNEAELADSLEVRWLSGKAETLRDVASDQVIVLNEKDAKKAPLRSGAKKTLYAKVDGILSPEFIHNESNFIDFQRDKLIPKMLSREGPGIAVADVDGDGDEDFFVAGAADQSGRLYIQTDNGDFRLVWNQPWEQDSAFEEICPLFVDVNNDDRPDLYVTSGSNEFEVGSQKLSDRIYINEGGNRFSHAPSTLFPSENFNHGVIRKGDFNNDGLPDLFIGGRVKNGDYPISAESVLLINKGDEFVISTDQWSKELKNIGIVADAVVCDINNDGLQDLVVCGEWMPVSIFINKGNSFYNATDSMGLNMTNGWWNSLIVTDLNNDGLLDIAAGNYGLNSVLKASKDEPLTCYHSDFDENGKNEPIICYYKFGVLAPYADRDLFTRTLPSYHNRFLTYRQYGSASIEDIFTENQLKAAKTFVAHDLESKVFLNAGGKFTEIPLPKAAQVAPIYGMIPADVDADGIIDLTVFGNTYSSFYEEGPMAALRGLVLKGNGDGSYVALDGSLSGLNVNKDSKAAAIVHIKHNDTYVVALTNNNAEMIFYEIDNPVVNERSIKRGAGGYLSNFTETRSETP